ncbi:hypothetical protein ABT336_23415 [Micromonospora sp. NPDC000207]|uniref:hypothetical protein n=1 Tax=Micromonospora sp. NPDC000207 TaxID=3154246 RepID=UPI00331F37DA
MTGSRRPRWPAAVAVLTLVGGVLGNVASNLLSELADTLLGPASIAVAVVGAVAAVVIELRRRRTERTDPADPTDVVTAPSTGAPTLPYPAGFTGRVGQVDAVVTLLRTTHAVAVVGRRAVGTSACAVQAANLCRDEFPDQQYYLDLRRGGRQRSPREVLTALARILGTTAPAGEGVDDLEAAADELRSHLDGRRILLVLDNVDRPEQVRALLPPAARTCRLLLAGTPGLAACEGLVPYWLEEPDRADAVELFAAAGGAVSAARRHLPDPHVDPAVAEIVDLCGRQPRVVRALGYRTAQHGWRYTDVRDNLRHVAAAPPHQRTPVSPAVRLVTDRDTAYHALSWQARRLFRLLSLSPAPLDRPAIGALAGRPRRQVAALLDELAAAAFVGGAAGDRYDLRPLLVPYARLHLRSADTVGRRVAAQARLTRHLARRAERHAANLQLTGALLGRERSLLPDDDPYAWFDLHQDLLLAVVGVPAGAADTLPRRVRRWWFRLAVALCGWLAHADRFTEWQKVCDLVLATPTAGDRPRIAGWAHNELGVLRRRQNDPHGAAAALTLAVAERGRRGTAQARMNLGLALLDLGQVDDAVEHLELSRRHRSGADRSGHALTDLGLGAARLTRGEPEAAHHHLVRAANTFRSLGDARGYAAALANLMLVYHRLGEHLDAAQAGRAVLDEENAGPAIRAGALLNAGAILFARATEDTGPDGSARSVGVDRRRLVESYRLLTRSRLLRHGRPSQGSGRTLLCLGDVATALGKPAVARRHWSRAAQVYQEIGDAGGRAQARQRLSEG